MRQISVLAVLLFACVGQKTSKNVLRSEGIILFSPRLNADYFFPLKKSSEHFNIENFMQHEYDTGFLIAWYKADWKYNVQDNYSIPLNNDNTFSSAAFVGLEYTMLKSSPRDSIYSFEFEYDGVRKMFVYDSKDRELIKIEGIK